MKKITPILDRRCSTVFWIRLCICGCVVANQFSSEVSESPQSLRYPVDTGRKFNVHKTFKGRPGRPLNVLRTFNLRPVSTGIILVKFYFGEDTTLHFTSFTKKNILPADFSLIHFSKFCKVFWKQPHGVACTCNPATFETELRNGVDSIPVRGNNSYRWVNCVITCNPTQEGQFHKILEPSCDLTSNRDSKSD